MPKSDGRLSYRSSVTSAALLGFCLILSAAKSFALSSNDEIFEFSKDFWWGAATSSHQVEGGNTNNDWYEWERAGRTKNGAQSGEATDHWNRYAEDFDLAKSLNLNAYRMSIEWSRVEPTEGHFNKEALAHYRGMLQAAKSRGLKVVLTLHHFTTPTWLSEKGGWLYEKTPELFERYSKIIALLMGDLVDAWTTINEPNIYVLTGYVVGETPPGIKDPNKAMLAFTNLVKAHALSYHAIKQYRPLAKVGFAHHMRIFSPWRWWNFPDRIVTSYINDFWNHQMLRALKTGVIEFYVPFAGYHREVFEKAKNTQDFIGINYYSRDYIRFSMSEPTKFRIEPDPTAERTDMGWEVYPDGFYQVLMMAAEYDLPIIVTENGIADAADAKRKSFLCRHLAAMIRAMKDGARVQGYLHWSLTDNFEWLEGFWPRFGLVEIDYATKTRRVRESAKYYAEVVASSKINLQCEP